MRRFLIASLVLVSVLAVASPASAAARFRVYRGKTSAGTRIAFLIRVADDGRMSMKGLRYKADLLCEDATTMEFFSLWEWGGIGERLDGRRLAFDSVYPWEALHVAGVFRAQTAEGTFRDSMPTLTEDEQAQLCTTGDLTWTAERVRVGLARFRPPRGVGVVHRTAGGTIRTVSRIG
jgi:hypothetical protein